MKKKTEMVKKLEAYCDDLVLHSYPKSDVDNWRFGAIDFAHAAGLIDSTDAADLYDKYKLID